LSDGRAPLPTSFHTSRSPTARRAAASRMDTRRRSTGGGDVVAAPARTGHRGLPGSNRGTKGAMIRSLPRRSWGDRSPAPAALFNLVVASKRLLAGGLSENQLTRWKRKQWADTASPLAVCEVVRPTTERPAFHSSKDICTSEPAERHATRRRSGRQR
jgi:hypothetical protein